MQLRSRSRHRSDPVRVVHPVVLGAEPAGNDATGPAASAHRGPRRRVVVPTVLAVLAAVAVVVAAGQAGDRDDGSRVSSAGSPGTTASAGTTASPDATAGPAVTTAPTATAAPTVTSSVPPAPAPTATTATAPSTAVTGAPAATDPCRNSSDPVCGPFRFEPQPAADRPMTVTVGTDPAVVRAGEEVVFRAVLSDPDGVSYNGTIQDFGDGSGLGASKVDRCARYGRWDPPAPDPGSSVAVVEYRHVYAAPGTYTARFSFDAGPFDCTDAGTGRGDRPYASSAAAELVVVVAP